MKVSVCIPTYKRPESLSITLGRLLGEASKIDEILIGVTKDLDESFGGMENTLTQLIEAFKIAGIDVKVRAELSGLMDAKRWFKETARNEILLFLDDDAVLGEGYFDLVKHFTAKEVGAVSGVLQTPINSMGYSDWSNVPIDVEDEFSNTLIYDHRRKTLLWLDKYQVYMHKTEKIFECEYLIGTALFVRKSVLEIDMEFQHGACGGEEIDFTYNIYQQGLKLLFDTSRLCWHLHEDKGGTREFDRKDDKKNFDYLVKKWGIGDGVRNECSHYQK